MTRGKGRSCSASVCFCLLGAWPDSVGEIYQEQNDRARGSLHHTAPRLLSHLSDWDAGRRMGPEHNARRLLAYPGDCRYAHSCLSRRRAFLRTPRMSTPSSRLLPQGTRMTAACLVFGGGTPAWLIARCIGEDGGEFFAAAGALVYMLVSELICPHQRTHAIYPRTRPLALPSRCWWVCR